MTEHSNAPHQPYAEELANRLKLLETAISDANFARQTAIFDQKTAESRYFQHISILVITSILLVGCALAVFGDAVGMFDIQSILPAGETGEPAPVTILDYVSFVFPFVLIVLAYFVGATGLKRLELYDTEFREARKERREDNERQQGQIDKRFSELSAANTKELESSKTQVQIAAREGINAAERRVGELEKSVASHDTEIKRISNLESDLMILQSTLEECCEQSKAELSKISTSLPGEVKKISNEIYSARTLEFQDRFEELEERRKKLKVI